MSASSATRVLVRSCAAQLRCRAERRSGYAWVRTHHRDVLIDPSRDDRDTDHPVQALVEGRADDDIGVGIGLLPDARRGLSTS